MFTTRDATLDDLPAIVDIYNQSIPAGTALCLRSESGVRAL